MTYRSPYFYFIRYPQGIPSGLRLVLTDYRMFTSATLDSSVKGCKNRAASLGTYQTRLTLATGFSLYSRTCAPCSGMSSARESNLAF